MPLRLALTLAVSRLSGGRPSLKFQVYASENQAWTLRNTVLIAHANLEYQICYVFWNHAELWGEIGTGTKRSKPAPDGE
jgi:hypothetical protein